MKFDLLLKGGRVFDPGQGIDDELDVALSGDRISTVEKNISVNEAERVLDVEDKIVTPGLIDLHTHIYWGISRRRVDPDSIAPYSGVTTMVDAGTANFHSWFGFKRFIVEGSQTRVYSFINASVVKEGAFPREHPNPITSGTGLRDTVNTIKSNKDIIIGVKTFAGYNTEIHPKRMLELSNEIAYHTNVPIMVHISFAPPGIESVLSSMHEGDILTHSFTGHTQRIVDRGGNLLPEAREAVERGVLFDIGHGSGSFSFQTAEHLLDQGVLPYTISTDLHSGCVNGPTFDLTTTISKFLNLGLSLEEVILRTTTNPADIIKSSDSLGMLKEGGIADLAVLELKSGDFKFIDSHKKVLRGNKKITATNTITRGVLMEEFVKKRYPPYQGYTGDERFPYP